MKHIWTKRQRPDRMRDPLTPQQRFAAFVAGATAVLYPEQHVRPPAHPLLLGEYLEGSWAASVGYIQRTAP